MSKKYSVLLLAVCAFPMLTLLTGCKSDGYYQARAVEEAREFLLKESPGIPLMEQEYIKFNRPFLMASQLSGTYTTGVAQICVCWMTPGNPDLYMVYGTSGMRMVEWSPVRVIRKRFVTPQHNYLALAQKASDVLIQKQFGLLSAESVNHIRYSMPGLWKCKFPLDLNPASTYSESELAAAGKMPRYVLAWQVKEKNGVFYSIYGGTAEDDTLKNFKFYFSGIYTEAEFKSNLVDEKPLIAPFGGTEVESSRIFL